MSTKKMNFASMQGKLSRTEMKNIMAGSGSTAIWKCCIGSQCTTCHQPACGPTAKTIAC